MAALPPAVGTSPRETGLEVHQDGDEGFASSVEEEAQEQALDPGDILAW